MQSRKKAAITCSEKYFASVDTAVLNPCYKVEVSYVVSKAVISESPWRVIIFNGGLVGGLSVKTVARGREPYIF
jgi:hypothetical protein